jgi:long-chain acyl-CoA synthetase
MPAKKQWSKFWPSAVPQHIDYPEVPLHELLKKSAKTHPEKPAITYLEREITYAELDLLSDQFAGALAALSEKKGDKAAVFLPNIPQFIIAYFGVLKAGAVVTAISPLHKEREVAYQLNDSEAETIVTLDTLYPIVDAVWRKNQAETRRSHRYGRVRQEPRCHQNSAGSKRPRLP